MSPLVDHTIAAIFPLMPPDELQQLADDIKAHGLRQDVVIYEGKILDGRNRYRACALAGVNVATREYKGLDPVGEVLSLNLHRRHLTAPQRAAIATEALPHFEEEAKKRMTAGHNQHTSPKEKIPYPSQSRDQAAAAVGVNPRYVSDAKRIKEEAPDTFEKLKAGEISMAEAKREIAPAKADGLNAPNLWESEYAIQRATVAVQQLEKIRKKDPFRKQALAIVAEWMSKNA